MAHSGGSRIAEIRARRLRASNAGVGIQKTIDEIILSQTSREGRDPNFKAANAESKKTQPVPPQILHKPHRPDSKPMISPLREPWYVPLLFACLH